MRFLKMLLKFGNNKIDIFHMIVKIYFFRMKISKIKLDNSAVVCGRLFNIILKNYYIL